MGNGNSAEWMEAARRRGINVDFLQQDKTRMYDMLHKLALPCPRVIQYHGAVDWVELEKEFEAGTHFFSRLVPRDATQPRPYAALLHSLEEAREFISRYSLDQFAAIHFVEKGSRETPISHTGGIIAANQRTIVELLAGDGPELFHGTKTPTHAEVGFTGRICYPNGDDPAVLERSLIFRALSLIGGPKKSFPGYYEFEVWGGRDIRFRNYQFPQTAYGRL